MQKCPNCGETAENVLGIGKHSTYEEPTTQCMSCGYEDDPESFVPGHLSSIEIAEIRYVMDDGLDDEPSTST